MSNTIQISTTEMKKISDFVAASEGHLNKQASFEKAAGQEIEEIVGNLVNAGVIDPSLKEASITAMKEDPVEVISCLKKASEYVELAQSTGNEATDKSASAPEMKADERFEQILLGNLSSN